jgi:hypothetical protein
MLLDDVKTVLGISDTLKDALLNVYIRKGTTLITNYMNTPIYGKANTTIGAVKYEAIPGLAGNSYTVTIVQGAGVSIPTAGVIDLFGNLIITLGTESTSIPLSVTASQIASLIFTGDGLALITATVPVGAVSTTVQVASTSRTLTPVVLVDVPTLYPDAIIEYVVLTYRKKGIEGLKSYSQGSRSGTYEDSLQQSVKDLLPSPFIRMSGVVQNVI